MKHWIVAIVAALAPAVGWTASYELVIRGGRVLDPETGLDATMNVGINGGRIAKISAEPLTGTRTIDAKGLVVAPGFIDLHQHGQEEDSSVLKAFDGVTSGLEMEIGVPDVKAFLARKAGHSLINYGTTASHAAARAAAFGAPLPGADIIPKSGHADERSRHCRSSCANAGAPRQRDRRRRTRRRHGHSICAGRDPPGNHSYLPAGREPQRAGVHAHPQRR